MKASTVAVRPTAAAVVAAEVIALAAFAALPPHRFGWWPGAVIGVAALVLLLITVYRRNAAAWVAARLRWRTRRTTVAAAGVAVDVPCGSTMVGVRAEPHEAITMVEVAGRAYTPTFLRGSALTYTENLLPLQVLIDNLDQPGGLRISIDVVQSGQRVRRGSGYPALYSTLLADRPAAGARQTRLIVRLDLNDSVEGLVYRRSIGAAAAAATDRIVTALRQHGVRATAVSAEELDEALAQLGAGLAAPPDTAEEDPADDADAGSSARRAAVRESAPAVDVGWRTLDAHPGHLSSWYFSPEDITSASLNQMWSLRSDSVVQVTTITKARCTQPQGGGPVLVSALVRTDDPQPAQQPPTLYLNPLAGDQQAAALWAAPTQRPRLRLPTATLERPDELEIPIGATGVLVGAALHDDLTAHPGIHRDDLVMWALTDPAQVTRILMNTSDFYVRQLIIRAAAAGERIAIYSDEPSRWHSVSQPNVAVVDLGRAPEFVPTIVVNDRRGNAPAGLSSTVITLADDADPGGPDPDLRFVQTSRSTVRISTAERTLDVAIVAFRQEQAWTG
ncbi:type VII secretion protein EccE [Mycobacterium sp. 155]|uniref:type VII secretion protein EccE n=1 Tax=Mycobacterium sp. 155 TaxID=1157943 RepID=UPI00037BE185|nr:type VII secretion protein EccE [Mycobacterium sp. 155]